MNRYCPFHPRYDGKSFPPFGCHACQQFYAHEEAKRGRDRSRIYDALTYLSGPTIRESMSPQDEIAYLEKMWTRPARGGSGRGMP
jgi:hypothetical protein